MSTPIPPSTAVPTDASSLLSRAPSTGMRLISPGSSFSSEAFPTMPTAAPPPVALFPLAPVPMSPAFPTSPLAVVMRPMGAGTAADPWSVVASAMGSAITGAVHTMLSTLYPPMMTMPVPPPTSTPLLPAAVSSAPEEKQLEKKKKQQKKQEIRVSEVCKRFRQGWVPRGAETRYRYRVVARMAVDAQWMTLHGESLLEEGYMQAMLDWKQLTAKQRQWHMSRLCAWELERAKAEIVRLERVQVQYEEHVSSKIQKDKTSRLPPSDGIDPYDREEGKEEKRPKGHLRTTLSSLQPVYGDEEEGGEDEHDEDEEAETVSVATAATVDSEKESVYKVIKVPEVSLSSSSSAAAPIVSTEKAGEERAMRRREKSHGGLTVKEAFELYRNGLVTRSTSYTNAYHAVARMAVDDKWLERHGDLPLSEGRQKASESWKALDRPTRDHRKQLLEKADQDCRMEMTRKRNEGPYNYRQLLAEIEENKRREDRTKKSDKTLKRLAEALECYILRRGLISHGRSSSSSSSISGNGVAGFVAWQLVSARDALDPGSSVTKLPKNTVLGSVANDKRGQTLLLDLIGEMCWRGGASKEALGWWMLGVTTMDPPDRWCAYHAGVCFVQEYKDTAAAKVVLAQAGPMGEAMLGWIEWEDEKKNSKQALTHWTNALNGLRAMAVPHSSLADHCMGTRPLAMTWYGIGTYHRSLATEEDESSSGIPSELTGHRALCEAAVLGSEAAIGELRTWYSPHLHSARIHREALLFWNEMGQSSVAQEMLRLLVPLTLDLEMATKIRQRDTAPCVCHLTTTIAIISSSKSSDSRKGSISVDVQVLKALSEKGGGGGRACHMEKEKKEVDSGFTTTLLPGKPGEENGSPVREKRRWSTTKSIVSIGGTDRSTFTRVLSALDPSREETGDKRRRVDSDPPSSSSAPATIPQTEA